MFTLIFNYVDTLMIILPPPIPPSQPYNHLTLFVLLKLILKLFPKKVLIQSCRQHLKASFASRPARMSKVKQSAGGLVEGWRSHTHKYLYNLTKSITYLCQQ